MGHYGYGMNGWFGGYWLLAPLAFVIVVVAVVYFLVRDGDGSRAGGPRRRDDAGQGGVPREDSALRVLRERYARGEIDQEEFERRKHDLS